MARISKEIEKQFTLILIGVALFAVFTKVQIPIDFVPSVYIEFRTAILAFMSALAGPLPGTIIGIAGHLISDTIFLQKTSWGWVIGEGFFGLFVGFFYKAYRVWEGDFTIIRFVVFNAVQIVANAVSWLLIAPLISIYFFNDTLNEAFVEGCTACIANTVTVTFVSSLLCLIVSLVRKRMIYRESESPTEENF